MMTAEHRCTTKWGNYAAGGVVGGLVAIVCANGKRPAPTQL